MIPTGMTEDFSDSDLQSLRQLAQDVRVVEDLDFWKSTPVAAVPAIVLTSWQVMLLPSGDRRLLGCNTTEGGVGRVSSRIVRIDANTRTAVTETGRVYELRGASGQYIHAQYVWRRWLVETGHESWVDVTAETEASLASVNPCEPDAL